MSGTARSRVLLELMQVSKSLHEVIFTSTARKNKVDDLIKIMSPKGAETSTSHFDGLDEGNNAKSIEEKDDNEIKTDVGGSEDKYEFVSSKEFEVVD